MTTRDNGNALVLSDAFVNVAPVGTALPTDLSTGLDAAFADVGWISENGLDEARENSVSPVYGVNGALIRNIKGNDVRKFTFECLERNAVVLGIARPGSTPSSDGNTSEVQQVTITGTPTGGAIKLKFRGNQTANIAFDADAAAVESALEALASVGAGNVSVTGGPGPDDSWIVTFGGPLANEDVPQMTATSTLTGGTTPAVAVTTATPGTPGVTTTNVKAFTGTDLRSWVLEEEFGTVNRRIVIAQGEAIQTGTAKDSRSGLSILTFELTPYPESDGTLYRDITDNPAEIVG